MSRDNHDVEGKMVKTGLLLGGISLATYITASFLSNSTVGLLITIAVDALAINKLHEMGKSRRAGSNFFNTVQTHVAARSDGKIPSMDLENSFRNVINGGAAVVDEIAIAAGRRPR